MKVFDDPIDRRVTEALHAWRVQYDAGVDFDKAIDTASKLTTGRARRALRRTAERVRQNDDLEAALGELSNTVPYSDRAMIVAGWASGKLALALDLVTERRAMLHRARKEMRGQLILPGAVLIVAAFVAPIVPFLLGEISTEQYLTRAGIPLSIFFGAIALVTALNRLRAWATPRRGLDATAVVGSPIDWLFLSTPIFSGVERVRNRAVVASTLGMATQAGLMLLDALSLTESVTPNSVYRRAVRKMAKTVNAGGNISETMTAGLWPFEWRAMVEVGETAGKLDESLVRLGKYANETYIAAIKRAAQWVPRLVYLLICIFIIWQMFSLFQRIASGYSSVLDSM